MKKKLSKLTLRINDIEQSDILSKRQLKHIIGGYDGESGGYDSITCTLEWKDGTTQTSTCRAKTVEECNENCKKGYPSGEPKCECK